MDEKVQVGIIALTEVAKLLLQAYFTQMAMAGQTPEQAEALFQEVKKQFDPRSPDKLNPVPKPGR